MVHPDYEELLKALLPFAAHMLTEHGEFLPFGGCVGADGEVDLIAGETEDENPAASDVIDVLVKAIAARIEEDGIRAAALCYNATVRLDEDADETDAVCVSLDHAEPETEEIDVVVPYTGVEERKPELGELHATDGSLRAFPRA